MTSNEQQAVITLALLAAFADGNNTDAERAEDQTHRRFRFSASGEMNIAAIYRDVLMKRVDMAAAAPQLSRPNRRALAYGWRVRAMPMVRNRRPRNNSLPATGANAGRRAGHAQSFRQRRRSLARGTWQRKTVWNLIDGFTAGTAEQDE